MSFGQLRVTIGPRQINIGRMRNNVMRDIDTSSIHFYDTIQIGSSFIATTEHYQRVSSQRDQPGFYVKAKHLALELPCFMNAI